MRTGRAVAPSRERTTPAALGAGADAHIDGGRLLTKAGAATLGAATIITIPE